MAINNDRNLLEQQILSNSGLKGKELENLRARLATLSEQQLQAELSKSLSGNNKGEWYTGVMLEHNESVIMRNNHEQTTYTDDSGNEISEIKDGDEVLERTIKSTDDKGNVFETIVTFSGGKPLTQTKSKNGNTTETTTYKYNDDADVSFVTVETKKADQSKVMTNVLEIDENGNFDNEDFIDRQTTSMDGTTTHIFTENNCVIEQQVKQNGKKIDTIYKGDSIEDYDNKKLHRVYQRTELKGEVHEVAYDGNGNTRTVVQNGESPSAIAKKFGVKESSLRKLNPARGKNAITQVGADIVVPGEYDADSRAMRTRKTKQGALNDYANDEVQRTAQRLYSSTMQEVTLDKDYKDAYSYARALLAADGVKNPSNEQINNKANEILVANGNIKFKKGTKVQIAAKTADSKFVTELSNNGFKPTRENAIFYNRFNALNPSQQQNVLSVIKYCKTQNITDQNKIKARILETFPEINLFDSGKTVPQNDFTTPAYQRKNSVALETFLTETLKLDLKSDVGRQVYERLSSLPQEELGKINGSNFGDLSKSNFNDIANRFESSGVNIRTQFENQIEQANRDHRAEMLGIPQQKFTSEMLANIYDRAADMMEEYYHNHGVLDAGTYLEGLKNITDWITSDNLFGIDMRSTLHVASDCRKAAQRFRQMHTDNPETFKREYAKLKKDGLVTADYNQQNVQEFMNLIQSGDVDINSDKFKNACKKAFGFKGVENTEKYIQTGQMAGNIGDIAVMLYTLGAASELKMMGKATQGVYGALEHGAGKIMSKTAAQKTAKIGTSMAMGGTTLGGFTLGKETLNNLSNPMRDATSWETWKETGIASAESFGFGAFGGLLNETVVAPIVKAIEKPATKATQAVSKALTEQGELTGKQIMQTVSESGGLKLDGLFKMNPQELANLARTATAKGVGFGVEVSGFTAYEAGLDIIKDLIDPQTGRLPENITVDSLTEYLGEKFGEQFSNLGTIKGVSQLLMMSKGGKVAQKAMMNEILSKSDALKDIKFKKAEISGHEVYEVTYPNGNRAVVTSPEQAIATCQMAMQMEFLVKSLSESEAVKPQGIETESVGTKQVKVKDFPPKHVARTFGDLPPVKDGYIRLIHRTSSENAEKIVQSGLYGEVGLPDTASPCRSEQEFWDTLTSPSEVQNAHGDTKVIIDMPIKEFQIFAGGIEYGDLSTTGVRYNFNVINGEVEEPTFSPDQGVGSLNRLVCPKKYIVGVCKHDRIFSENEIQRLKEQTSKNPLQDVEETDLAPYEIFKQKANELYTQNDDWDFDLNFEDTSAKELTKKTDDWMKGFNIGEEIHTTPRGMNAQEDALIQKARKENPATIVEEKVRKQWQQHDIETTAPDEKVDLFNLDPNAGLKEPMADVQNEVTSLIFKGKLNETLIQRYDEMGRVFTEIAQKRASDIETLAKANPKNKQAVADGIVKILAQELGMEGFEPPIVFENTNGGDGFADWPNGRIVVNKDITNVKKLTSMISHEFVHMLQYRDVLAQYGEQGLRDLIANDKSIPENEKEQHIKKALNNPYNQHLLQSYDFQKAQTGTVNDYLRRIYKDEFTNTVGTDNMPEYINQAAERGAYSSQEQVDRGLDESNLGELSVGEYVPNDASLAALRAKMKAKLQAGQDVTSNNSLNRTSEHTEDIEINSDGTVTRKGVPAGISDSELTEVAPFARRLVNSEQTLINEKVIRDIEQTLTKRMIDKTSEEEKLQIKSIVNKITPKNLELIEIMTADKDISNELILNILDSCNKPYKISMLGLFNPVNIPIFLLQNSGFIGDIKLNDNLKRDYAKRLLTNKNVSKKSIPVILQNVEKGNSKLVDKALNSKNFDFNTLSAILRNTLHDNSLYVNGQKSVSNSRVKFAESLIDNPNFPNDCISDVVWWYGIENVNNKFLENLCNNKDFPPQQIETLIRNMCSNRKGNSYMFNTSEPKFKQKLAERLIEDNNCPNEYVADIIGSIEKRQEVLFEQIYADKNIPKSEISSILYLDYGLSKGIEKLDLPNKIAILSNSVSVSDLTLTYLKKYNIDKIKIDELVNKISMEMGLKKENIQTNEIHKQSLFKNYISNNSNIEETINNIDLNKYPHGIPMKYSRIQFTKDINNLLSNLSTEDKVAVQSYFSINIENGKFEGFPIIPEQTKIIKEELLPVIEKIKEKIIDFTQKNETTINDPELKKILDSIIQGCPEYATIIGKTQHGTHQYTVDVHTLKVLQNIFRDPEYKNLDDESKTVLKFSVLLHDIGKKEGVIDKTHYETSAKYAVSILEKYKLSPRVKSRIIETIYNHHWFEQYNKNEINANLVNAIFRTPKDLQLGMLMAKADLAGVSDDFHYKITKTHNQTDFNEYFDKKRDELFVQQNARYKNLNLVMDTKFSQTDTRKFPTEKVSIKGKDIQIPVLNLTDEALPNDLHEFGFSKGVTRNNAKFLAHFNDRIKGLKVFMALSSSPTTESVQSLSMISLNNSRTFKNQIYGVITDIDMANVAQASNTNISSGYKKDLKNFAKDLYGFWQVNTYVRDNFINELDKAGISLTKEEYVELAKQLVNIQYSTQINKDIKIGNKTIPAELLQSALNESRDRLFDGDLHSEIVAINPRIKALVARVSSINECSIEFLELATENNLPIILIGHNEHGKIY
ncbi:MAG: hypothetical protein VZR09_09360 [Candidatus Gastranaerophilaceae bacterium]|nr:hypothetical protein [Candidatus Gastranaerophilaceae bacterium]